MKIITEDNDISRKKELTLLKQTLYELEQQNIHLEKKHHKKEREIISFLEENGNKDSLYLNE